MTIMAFKTMIHTSFHTRPHTKAHVHTHACAHTYTHTYVHAHTDAHTCTSERVCFAHAATKVPLAGMIKEEACTAPHGLPHTASPQPLTAPHGLPRPTSPQQPPPAPHSHHHCTASPLLPRPVPYGQITALAPRPHPRPHLQRLRELEGYVPAALRSPRMLSPMHSPRALSPARALSPGRPAPASVLGEAGAMRTEGVGCAVLG